MSSLSVQPEWAGTIEDRRNLDNIMFQSIDDSVVSVKDLSNRLVAKLRHDSSRARMVREPFHGGDDPLDNKGGVVRGVASDIRAYRLDVLDGLRCPR